MLSLLLLAILFPLSKIASMENTEAASSYNEASVTVSTTRGSASISIDPSITGSFVQSDLSDNTNTASLAKFGVATTNATGYTLSIAANSNGTSLKSGSNTLSALPSNTTTSAGLTATQFNTATYNNTWGYIPSKYNSSTNTTKFYPMTTTATTLDTTTSSNTTANSYTIGLGARVNYKQDSGTYTLADTFILTAVGNAASYSITYDANGGSGAPSATGVTSTSAQYIALSSTIPTRTGYDFLGWCTSKLSDQTTNNNGSNACTSAGGTYYASGSNFYIDETTKNVTTLYAVWYLKDITVTGVFAGTGVTAINFANATYGNKSITTNNTTTTIKYGASYTITGSYSSGNEFSSWATTAGTLGSTSSASTTYSTTTAATLTLTGKSSGYTITFKTSNASGIVFNGTTYTNNQTVTIAEGTYSIYGTYATKYAWSSWAATTGSFGNQSYQNTTYTVTGNATITLTGQSVTSAMQNFSGCSTTAKPVYDNRDNTVYWVQQLADGKCWMLDNLAFDAAANVNAISTSNTNISSSGLSALKSGGSSPYSASAISSTWGSNTYTDARINVSNKDKVLVSMDAPATTGHTKGAYGPGQNKWGVFYNYCAASGGTYCYASSSSSGNASYDLCPAGWHLPSTSSSNNVAGSYYYLYNTSYSANAANLRSALSAPLSGSFNNGSAYSQGSYGIFWSSTRYNNNSMYILYVNSSSVRPASSNSRNYGYSVRCVR